MKKAIFILIGLLLLVVIGVGTYFWLHQSPATPGTNNGMTFPNSGPNNGPGQIPSGVPQLTVQAQDGSSITTLDFKHNGVSFEDPSNKGNYYIAGTNGICNPDGTCPKAGDITDYTILYFAQDNSFVVGLNTEPLGSVRKEAEQSLMKSLGISESAMCKLKYEVTTTSHVNETYGGESLGFSFCLGATKLP